MIGATLADHVRRDLRHALRGFRHAPGLTLAVIVMLALGIGANAAMFNLVDAVRALSGWNCWNRPRSRFALSSPRRG
jgi:hypothetical protein